MLTGVCFYYKDVVHHECAPPGQTIYEEYVEVFRQLRDAVRRKCSCGQLHYASAPAHSSQLMQALFRHITSSRSGSIPAAQI